MNSGKKQNPMLSDDELMSISGGQSDSPQATCPYGVTAESFPDISSFDANAPKTGICMKPGYCCVHLSVGRAGRVPSSCSLCGFKGEPI